jgi:hypothetical protein
MNNLKIIGTLLALLMSMGAQEQCDELIEQQQENIGIGREASRFNTFLTKQLGGARINDQNIPLAVTDMLLDAVLFDAYNMVDITNNRFVISRSGLYKVSANIVLNNTTTSSTGTNSIFFWYTINSDPDEGIGINTFSVNNQQIWHVPLDRFIPLEAGDVIKFRMNKANNTTNVRIVTSPSVPSGVSSFISVEYIGPDATP